MSRRSSTAKVALARALAALSLPCALFASGCGRDSPDGAAEATPPAHASRAPTATGKAVLAAKKRAVLPVAQRGNPILWVRKGQSVLLRASPGGEPVKRLRSRTEYGSPTVLSVDHVSGAWAAAPTPLLPNGQLGWVKLDPQRLGSGFTNLSIDIDLSRRMATFSRGKQVIDRFSVTVGAPGVETPTGRFAVTDTFRGGLDESAYGCCAVALTAHQPHLPSGWLGGNRIAIHGTYGPLGEALSHGCVRAANEDVSLLVEEVSLGTPVTIHG